MNQKLTVAIAIIVIASLLVAGVYAATTLWVNSTNSISGTPLTPAPSPSPTQTPLNLVGAILTANNTNVYVGDHLQITVTCNSTGVRTIQLYDGATLKDAAPTNTAGVAVFTQTVTDPYNFTAKVYNEIP